MHLPVIFLFYPLVHGLKCVSKFQVNGSAFKLGIEAVAAEIKDAVESHKSLYNSVLDPKEVVQQERIQTSLAPFIIAYEMANESYVEKCESTQKCCDCNYVSQSGVEIRQCMCIEKCIQPTSCKTDFCNKATGEKNPSKVFEMNEDFTIQLSGLMLLKAVKRAYEGLGHQLTSEIDQKIAELQKQLRISDDSYRLNVFLNFAVIALVFTFQQYF